MTRRFEHGDRFWEITTVRDRLVRVHWGLIGGASKVHETFADSVAEARSRNDDLIAGRLREGFVEVSLDDAAPDVPAVPRWWARFERGAAYLELELADCVVRQRRGDTMEEEIDTATRHPERDGAREMVERVTRLALGTGYKLVREGKPVVAPGACEPALEAECLADLDSESPWAVYADWLIAQGDLRGELAALHLGGKHLDADRLLHAERARLFGVNADTWMRTLVLSWRHGFATGAHVHSTQGLVVDELVRELLELPIARFLDTLHVEACDNETLGVICRSAQAPRIRELRIERSGDFKRAWAKLPALEVLHVDAYSELGTGDHPALHTLVLSSTTYTRQLEDFARLRLPRLAHPAVELGEVDDANVPRKGLRALLASEGLPALSHLALTGCSYLEQLVPLLATSPLVARLHTLELSNGQGRRAAASALVTYPSSFAHLARLDVSGNQFTAPQLAQLAKVLPNLDPGTQRTIEKRAPPQRRPKKPPPGSVLPIRRKREP